MTAQAKSGTKPPLRKRARKPKAPKPNGANGTAEPKPGELGSSIKVKPDDIATLEALRAVRDDHQQHLGLERHAYLTREAQRIAALQKSNEEYEAIVLAVARKLGLVNETESWQYQPQTQTFIRTK